MDSALAKFVKLLDSKIEPLDLVAISIASCISLASIKQNNNDYGPKDFHPSIDHVYWETRENALAASRKYKIFFPKILQYYIKINQNCTTEEIEQLSCPYWDEIASPTILINDVMGV